MFADAEVAVEETDFDEKEALAEEVTVIEETEHAEVAVVEDAFAEDEDFDDAHEPEDDIFGDQIPEPEPLSAVPPPDPVPESVAAPSPSMQAEAPSLSPPVDLGDDDELELTKEEEALLEAELDGEDIDLDDDWGDDEF